jgi:hypothetical protein
MLDSSSRASKHASRKRRPPEPRWPAISALLAIGVAHFALPENMTIGPDWLLLVVISLLLVPVILARQLGQSKLSQWLGYGTVSLVTLDMVWSICLLIRALPSHRESPVELLRSALVLWVSNVLVFASWYWRLDAGGPNARDLRDAHTCGAFLFPQMTLQPSVATQAQLDWSPGFVDYLFLAFNTSTAFSPTDVPVLSRWAKLLMMVQASISLTVVIVLAARAINIL